MSDHFIRSSRSNIFHRITFKHGSTSVYWTFGILFSIILLGILAPIMPIQDPIKPNPLVKLSPPSMEHFFGTDHNGMDVFSRTIFAIRTDFTLALSSVLLGILIGVPLGAISGYFGYGFHRCY